MKAVVRTIQLFLLVSFSFLVKTGYAQTPVLAADSLALVSLYNNTNGAAWTNNTNWLSGPVSTWYGVTLASGRVYTLSLVNNNLNAALPSEIGDLTELTLLELDSNRLVGDVPVEFNNLDSLATLGLSFNSLTGLPDLTGMLSLTSINVQNNNLTFEDLEPNIALPSFVYSPQKNYGARQIVSINGGADTLRAPVGGTANSYQWVKDGVPIASAIADSFVIPSTTENDEGVYHLSVTNSITPGLTLQSQSIDVGWIRDYYWIGNGGQWYNLAHWSHTSGAPDSVGTPPDIHDNVHFDANSFTLPGQVVTIPDLGNLEGGFWKNMDWRGVTNHPTFQIRADSSEWIGNTSGGSLYFDDNMTLDFYGAEFYMDSQTDYDFDTRGHHLGENSWVSFNLGYGAESGSAITAHILSDINYSRLYLYKDTLDFNGHSFIGQTGDYPALWLNGTLADPAVADLSNSVIDLGTLHISPNSTLIDDNAQITLRNGLRASNQDFNYVKLGSVTMDAGSGDNTFGTLEILPGATVSLKPGTTQTVTNLIANGTALTPIHIKSTAPDSVATISKSSGTVSVNSVILQDNNATGGAIFNAYNSLDSANNMGWNFINTDNAADSLVLVNFYNSNGGANWTNKTNWLTGALETWWGVNLEGGRVVSLNLTNNNVTGSIPAEFENLTNLKDLFLGDNEITGTLPAELGNLTNLLNLNLDNNLLTDTIPSQWGNMTSLGYLSLGGNTLTGSIPAELANISTLRLLYLWNNQLTGEVPGEFNNLDALTDLHIQGNSLSGLPDLTGMASLSTLVVGGNNLSFEDILPNIGIAGIVYYGQKNLAFGGPVTIVAGSPMNLAVTVSGVGNTYQWKKGFQNIAGATSASYSVPSTGGEHMGTYYLEITNSGVPDLILRTNDFLVEVSSPLATEESGYTFLKKMGAEALSVFQHFPHGIASGSSGTVYAQTTVRPAINKFGSDGSLLNTIDYLGTGPGKLPHISDMVVDSADNLYISDEQSYKVVKYNASGVFQFEITNTDWNYGIALDSAGDIVICPRYSPTQFEKYDGVTGAFMADINFINAPTPGIYLDIEVDQAGNIYAIEASIPRIDKYSSTGTFLQSFDGAAIGLASWSGWDFTLAPNGDIYWVAGGYLNHFAAGGNLVGQYNTVGLASMFGGITTVSSGIMVSDYDFGLVIFDQGGNWIENFGPQRNANGVFNNFSSIAMGPDGFRYIADYFNSRIQKFDSNGNFVSIIGSEGTGATQLKRPQSVIVDRFNNVYVADTENHRIQKYSDSGTHLATIGSQGTGNGQFMSPSKVVISKKDFLLVLDAGNQRIQKFDASGTHLLTFGEQGTGPGLINNAGAMTVENDGNILLVNNQPTKLMRFNEDGQFLGETLLGFQHIEQVASDNSGGLYVSIQGQGSTYMKLDKNGAILNKIAPQGLLDGQLSGGGPISANPAGDTLWVGSTPNRISIFYANFKNVSSADSLALVDLYNSTNGGGWTNNTNWLTGNVNTWFGVSMSAGKIRSIQLSANNLEGTLPPSISSLNEIDSLDLSSNKLKGVMPDLTGLTSLQKLDLSGNQLTGSVAALPVQLVELQLSNNQLSVLNSTPEFLRTADVSFNDLSTLADLTGKNLQSLYAEENKLTFEDLEPNITISEFTYIPQDSTGEVRRVVRELSDTLTLFANQGGTGNQYQWFKNGSAINGATLNSLHFNAITLEDDAFYNVEIQNTIVPGLTLKTFPAQLRVSSIVRDSLALTKLFNNTAGGSWTNNSGWMSDDLGRWQGITLTNNRVTEIKLPANNLDGNVPDDILDMLSLNVIDLSDNALTALPDLTPLANLDAADVSGNKLNFGSLIGNASLAGIDYSNQARIGVALDTLIDVGSDYKLNVTTGGTGNVYSWKRNGSVVAGATDSTYTITAINRSNMGEYVMEVTNPQVANLTLTSNNQRVRATASIRGSLMSDESSPATEGTVTLFRITEANAYDTTAVMGINDDGTFAFERVVLDDYSLLGFADTLVYESVLPTYYEGTILWEEADTLYLENNIDSLNIISQVEPGPPSGKGSISGYLQEDDGTGGRIKNPQRQRRIARAGVSARRIERTGRTKGESLTLVAYVFTNEQGEFTLPNLPPGEYRLNFQYPGYPMDETSYTTVMIGDALESQVMVEANVVDGMISVRKLIITGLYEAEKYYAEVYPNPAAEHIHLKFAGEVRERFITLSDISGKMIHTVHADKTDVLVDVGNLQKGLYILRINEGGVNVKTLKISIE